MVIIKNVHPAIVSEEEYELVKATITFMNKPGYRGTRKICAEGESEMWKLLIKNKVACAIELLDGEMQHVKNHTGAG